MEAARESGQFTLASSTEHEVVQRHFGHRIRLDQRDGKGVEHRYGPATRLAQTRYFERFAVRYDHLSDHRLRVTTPDGKTHTLWHNATQLVRENANGTAEALSFDAEGRLCARACWRQEHPTQSPFWSTLYRYNAAGELVASTDGAQRSTAYEYDADHRLVAQWDHRGEQRFGYDPAGNLIRTPRHGFVEYAAGNLPLRTPFEGYEHDARLRRAKADRPGQRITEYRYDSLDQLVEVRFSDREEVWRAGYDGLGRRIWREYGGARTEFYWDEDRLAAERFPDGQLRLYVYANEDALVPFMWLDYASEDAAPESGRAFYLYASPTGMPLRVEDADGHEVWHATALDPYGHLADPPDHPCPTRLRFAGHFHDEHLDLFYNRFRDYDPFLGRYLQPDPLGHAGGINLFAYPANPVVEVDLRGLVHRKPKTPRADAGEGTGRPKEGGERPAMLKEAELEAQRRGLVRNETDAGPPFPPGTRRVQYGDPPDATYHVDSQGRILRAEGALDPPATYKKEGVDHVKPDGFVAGQDHRGHLIPERSAATQDHANVRENVIAEHGTESNTSVKKRFENRARRTAGENPGSRMISEPIYEGDNPRPKAVTHTVVDKDGNPIRTDTMMPNPETIPNPDYS